MHLKDIATSLRAAANRRALRRKPLFEAMQEPPLPFDTSGFRHRASTLITGAGSEEGSSDAAPRRPRHDEEDPDEP